MFSSSSCPEQSTKKILTCVASCECSKHHQAVWPCRTLCAGDHRGMRLADSCFLTLGVNILQIYVGIRCGRPDIVCRYHHPGFDFWLCLGIVSSLIGSTLSYFSMEMNDLRARTDSFHVLQLTSFLIYRLLEIAARTTLLALFAVRSRLLCRHPVIPLIHHRLEHSTGPQMHTMSLHQETFTRLPLPLPARIIRHT